MKFKSWNTCEECADKAFPNFDKSRWAGGITVMIDQTCPDCGKEGVTLTPLADYGASYSEYNFD